MTPDELRALADALEPMARAPLFEDFDVPAFCAWVRACADAKPVARICTDGWQLVPVKPTREMLESTSWPGCAATDYEHMLAAAPPAERPCTCAPEDNPPIPCARKYAFTACMQAQAEPKLGELMLEQRRSRVVAGAYPDGNPNAGAMMAQTSQAEPKRSQTCLWSRSDDDTNVWETACGNAFTINEGSPADNEMVYCCYCGRELKGETGGSDDE